MHAITSVLPQVAGTKHFYGFLHVPIDAPRCEGVIITITCDKLLCRPVIVEENAAVQTIHVITPS